MFDKVKVTISREDGSPLFSRDESDQVEYLTKAAPVLVAVLDGGTVRTMQGDLQNAMDFIKGLTMPD